MTDLLDNRAPAHIRSLLCVYAGVCGCVCACVCAYVCPGRRVGVSAWVRVGGGAEGADIFHLSADNNSFITTSSDTNGIYVCMQCNRVLPQLLLKRLHWGLKRPLLDRGPKKVTKYYPLTFTVAMRLFTVE